MIESKLNKVVSCAGALFLSGLVPVLPPGGHCFAPKQVAVIGTAALNEIIACGFLIKKISNTRELKLRIHVIKQSLTRQAGMSISPQCA